MKFTLRVKDGPKDLAFVEGRDVGSINMADFAQLIEMEQLLERMFGHRFHIFQVLGDETWPIAKPDQAVPVNPDDAITT